MRFLRLAAVSCLTIAGVARAQNTAPSRVPIPTRSYIGINPIGLPFDVATVEFESGVAQGMTVGGVASYIDFGDPRFTSFDVKVRYYPGEIVLRGVSIGGSFGYTQFSNEVGNTRETLNAPTIGMILDHNWVYGQEQHFLLGIGAGAKRVIATAAQRDRANVDRAVLTARLIVGFAF